MEVLILFIVLVIVAYAYSIYRAGKRTGSRQGFHAGRMWRRRRG